MRTYELDHWVVVWSPELRELHVGPYDQPDPYRDNSRRYPWSAGCCTRQWYRKTRDEKLRSLLGAFFYFTVELGFDPKTVAREFSKIEGWAEATTLPILDSPTAFRLFDDSGNFQPECVATRRLSEAKRRRAAA
jgi:hypothetical protein